MGNVAWTDEELERLKRGVEDGETDAEIAAELPARTAAGVRSKADELGLPPASRRRTMVLNRTVAEGPGHTILTADLDPEEPIEELKDWAIKRTSRACDVAAVQSYAMAQIVTDQPIAISFISDQHIATNGAVDLKQMYADAELIRDTPGVWAMLGGDGIDNAIKHRSALVNSGTKPSDDWRLFNNYMAVMGYKTLAVISGNHCNWSVQFAGIDLVAHLAKMNKVHYSPDHVIMNLRLDGAAGTQDYTIAMRHKYRYHSNFNLGHAVKRMWEQGDDDFDVGCICHNHPAGGHVESFTKHKKLRWAVRPGSYQVQTGYSRGEGYPLSGQTCPTVIFHPFERRMDAFPNLRQAIDTLNALRAAP